MTVEITLPDELAQKARNQGLLSPESLEEMFREKLREQAVKRLHQMMLEVSAANTEPEMSLQEIADVVWEVRKEMSAADRQ